MRRCLIAGTATVALFLIGAASASGFEEVGNRCAADDAVQNSTLIGLASNSPPPPHPQVPQGDLWTITRWRVEVGPGLEPFAQQLVVFRWPEESQSYRKTGESAFETVAPGTNEFQSRIPVMELQHIGLYGPEKTFVCRNDPLSLAGVVEGSFPIESTRRYEALGETGVPVVAIVEPDRDLDYYGDETQDECPWTAAYQTDCPAEKIDILSTAVMQRAILVEVQIAYMAAVEAFGQVSWAVRRKSRPGAAMRSRKGVLRRTAGLSADIDRAIGPARPVTFRLPLPKSVQGRLDQLAPRRALRAKLTFRTTDYLNGFVERKLTVRLPGRARPQPPR
jgi:hypothetical protein